MYDHWIELAIDAALEAGGVILQVQESNAFRIRTKKDRSPVTDADMGAHRVIVENLKITGIPILSEEGRDISWEERKNWERYWLVDPLDGTKEFISGTGEYTVNIALMENNRPLAGVVFAPVTGELYYNFPGKPYRYSLRGHGDKNSDAGQKTGNEEEGRKDLYEKRPLHVVASRSHRNRSTNAFLRLLRQEHPDLKVVSRGSSLKFCMMASGEADLYPRLGPTMEWDTAAGQAIAESAGCRVLRMSDHRPLVYNKPDLTNPWFVVTSPY